jgi:L-fuconolactonase
MLIDAHHHFWKYTPAEYGWIDERMKVLRRDFLPEHLRPELASGGLDGVVTVQARQSVAETDWLLALAVHNDFIKGVVGWAPLTAPDAGAQLERWAHHRKLKGVRHVLHDEPDPNYMLRPDFNAGIRALRPFDLRYDILVFERHLPQTIQFVDQHPEQVFILDHMAKPLVRGSVWSPWWENLRALARRENVYCKVSGLVTEADWRAWTPDQLRPYWDAVLEAFGPRRLMFGSDWPVCLLASPYSLWLKVVRDFVALLSADEKARVLGGTAVAAYGLESA